MEKYLQYNIEDFAEDEAFIRWVKKGLATDEQQWSAWLAKYPEKKPIVQQAKLLVKSLQFEEAAHTKAAQERVWSKIKAQTQTTTVKPAKTAKLRYLLPLAAAAAVALLLIWFNFGQTNSFDTTISNPIAQQATEKLPDGSTIHINTASLVRYDKQNWADNRLVYLEGEAFFEVVKGAEFTVETKNGTIEVLGTSFNVFARNDALEVVCETGKVAVTGASKTTILTPQQGVSIVNNQHILAEEAVIELNRSEWRKGIYRYKGEELSTVFEDMERKFDVEISADQAINELLFTGSFSADKIEDALYEVCWPLNLVYKISGNQVLVSRS